MTLMQRAEKIQVQNYLAADVLHCEFLRMHMVLICWNYSRNYPVISANACIIRKMVTDANSSSLKQELKSASLQYYQLFDWKKSECADRSVAHQKMKERKQEFVRMNQTQINETKSKNWV